MEKMVKPAMPKVLVGLTAYRTIEQKTVQALFNAMAQLPIQFSLVTHTSANVWKGRNGIVEHFLSSEADYLLFVDADMVFTGEDMGRLVESIVQTPDAGLVGGLYVSRDEQMRPLVSWTDENRIQLSTEECIKRLLDNRGELVEADLIPTGFMIIRREVLEELENPWFHVKTTTDDEGNIHHYSSDNVFVHKVQDAGYNTYGHLGIELGHIGSFVYHPAHMWPQLEAWSAMSELQQLKAEFGEKYGYNSKDYWDSLYAAEHALGRERVYPGLHKIILEGIQPHWSVLDVGSGPGVLASQMEQVASEVDCLDLSEVAVKACESKGLTASVWDIVNDPVQVGMHGTYDCVVCTEVIEHLEDPSAAIKKLYSFLKQEGLIVISVPDNRLPPEEEPEHVATYTAAKMAKLLQPFDNVFVESINGYLLGVGTKPSKD